MLIGHWHGHRMLCTLLCSAILQHELWTCFSQFCRNLNMALHVTTVMQNGVLPAGSSTSVSDGITICLIVTQLSVGQASFEQRRKTRSKLKGTWKLPSANLQFITAVCSFHISKATRAFIILVLERKSVKFDIALQASDKPCVGL